MGDTCSRRRQDQEGLEGEEAEEATPQEEAGEAEEATPPEEAENAEEATFSPKTPGLREPVPAWGKSVQRGKALGSTQSLPEIA